MKKGRWLMIVGCLMMLGAFLFSGLDIYRLFTFEKVDAAVEVYRSPKGKKARVTYEYGGEIYEDYVLSSYNAFTMKNGKKMTVLIDPAKPENPHVTNFAMETLFLLGGVLILYGELKQKDD